MNIYNKSSVIEFYQQHAESKGPLEVWYNDLLNKNWKNPNALKMEYGREVSILKNNRVVFNIKGNKFRLVAEINYLQNWLFIKFIGTHSQYDIIDANTINSYKPKRKPRKI